MYAIFVKVNWGAISRNSLLKLSSDKQLSHPNVLPFYGILSTTQKPTKGLPSVSLDGKWELVTFLD